MASNLTPSFERAFKRCEHAGQDTGERIEHYRCAGRLRTRKKWVSNGLNEAQEALRSLSAATDEHTIACGPEIVSGDEIIFIGRLSVQAGCARRTGRRMSGVYRTELSVQEARVMSIGIDHGPLAITALVDGCDEPERLVVNQISQYGVWRKAWTDEWVRDGSVAEIMAQREVASEDYYRCCQIAG